MRNHKFANLCVALIVFYIVVAVGMKIARGTALDDFLTEHNLEFPREAKEQMAEQNLVAGAGILNEKEQIFTVFFLPRQETFDTQEFDPKKAVIKVHFYLVKKRVIVEGVFCKECQRAGKCWPNNRTERIYVFYDYWKL